MSGRALFLDRDGTLVQPRHYPSRPEHLVLFEGIEAGLHDLQSAGFRIVIVTNQSGIARGLFTEEDLALMHTALCRSLDALGVHVDAIYHCPHHIAGTIPPLAVDCDCRKPRPGMLLQAAADLDLDLSRSWFLGDILDDVEAGNRAGTRTVLVDLGTESPPDRAMRQPSYVARDTAHALAIVRAVEGLSPEVDFSYQPPAWSDPPVAGELYVGS